MSTSNLEQASDPGAKSYHHGDLRNALIDAGVALLPLHGAQGLSLREVARQAGVSHAAPYRHFADKDALLAAIAEQGFLQLAAATQAAIELEPDDPQRQLLEAGWAYVRFGLEHPQHLRIMFSGLFKQPNCPESLHAAGDSAFGLLVGIIVRGQEVGVVIDGRPDELALAAWALVHGLALILIEGQLPHAEALDPEQLVRRIGDVLYVGLMRR